MSFKNLDLSAELLRAIAEQNHTEPTPVQKEAIPPILKGLDVMVAAQTGTGKTAAFSLPLLQNLHQAASQKERQQGRVAIRALILTPTRELAAQVQQNVYDYGKYLPLKSAVVFGGVSINTQITKLRQGVDILVATPGRLLDLMGQNVLSLSKIEIFVLDEADRMLDMGFIHDIRRILKLLPQRRQNLLFSATFSAEIKELANKLLRSPTFIDVARSTATPQQINQIIYPVDRGRKRELLSHMIGSKNWRQVLVFTRTKHGANHLEKQLNTDGLAAAAIHGNKSQAARTRALADFKNGKVRVLVATDIAARGIDIESLPHVVNFDLPHVPEDYVHRVGRTGRASNDGTAISLVCVDEHKLLRDIEKHLKRKLPQEVISGYEPDLNAKPKPIQLRSNTNNRGGRPASKRNGSNQQRVNTHPAGQRRSNSTHRNRNS